MRMGVLDVGSNTVHLLVVDARLGGPPIPAASHKSELRLAEHLTADGDLSDEGADKLIESVRSCRALAEDTGCAEVLAFVTSALREASNSDAVLARVLAETGQELEILSGGDEARMTFLAVRRWYGWSAGTLAVLDIGGGSLELSAGGEEAPEVALSVPVGAGRVHRTWSDEDGSLDVGKVRKDVRAQIGGVIGDVLRAGPFEKVVATSKTFRSLSRISGAAPSSQGPYVPRSLKRGDVSAWVPKLATMKPAERAQLPGVSAGRAPQLLAGAIVAEAAMELAGVDVVDVCPWALREGLLLDRLDRL
ncbi:MAG: Ppx/GppA family phosphatase [Propionibacteriales bacterium]|nr:Ppx/GppA family phosphatase [Propionibacteriales bacterium]